jgi:long-subunit acyl-CoA synthetase (AMP-forming)
MNAKSTINPLSFKQPIVSDRRTDVAGDFHRSKGHWFRQFRGILPEQKQIEIDRRNSGDTEFPLLFEAPCVLPESNSIGRSMSLDVACTSVVNMFHRLTIKYSGSPKPYLLWKQDGVFAGLTHREVGFFVVDFAHRLHRLGVHPGDRVLILSENRHEWVVSDLALLSLGCVDVPVFPSQTAKQLAYIINDCEAVAVVLSNSFQLAKIQRIQSDVRSLKHIVMMNQPIHEQVGPNVHWIQDLIAQGRTDSGRSPDLFRHAADRVTPDDLCTTI